MNDLNLEANILNAMCSYTECLDVGVYELDINDFADNLNKKIFETIQVMYRDNKKVSLITVYEELKDILKSKNNRWMFVKEAFISSAEFKYLADELKDLTQKRKLQGLAENIMQMVSNNYETDQILKAAQNQVYSISDDKEEAEIITPKRHAERILETIDQSMSGKGNGGIATSYWKLNKAVNGGHQPGELLIIAAETGKGKTAFAMNMMRDIAIQQKIVSLYINTEMNDAQMDNRWATILTKHDLDITYNKVATGNLSPEELNKVVIALNAMDNSGFYSVTIPDLTIDDVYSVSRRFKLQKDIRFLVVDYVGRMETSDPRLKEYQVLKTITKRLKTLAQQLGITIIMLAQMTEDHRLEGSKGMKNECDLFAYLRDMTTEEQLEYGKAFNYFMVIDKNRNGPRGMIPLRYVGEKMLFLGEEPGEHAKMGSIESKQREDYHAVRGKTGYSSKSSNRKFA